MSPQIQSIILRLTNASAIVAQEVIQNLWSDYGEIVRIKLLESEYSSVVVKHIQHGAAGNHPRGWNSDIGHQRKLKSYEVETAWYDRYALTSKARIPRCIAVEHLENEILIVLEDLNASGFNLRKSEVSWTEMEACIQWLAQYHAGFIGMEPERLWEVGTYWHLATRPNELEALDDVALKNAASAIDEQLNSCTYKTLVHGDAKLANFCFSPNGEVAGVDFQYVGGGCGMKDLAYFVSSCLYEEDCERYETRILNTYFRHLQNSLPIPNPELEAEWRSLYHVAWADFHRFIKGWSPGHWKINSYSERVTKAVIGR
ncbi:phosphotransferase [Phaeocystidibacter marisrubri]|uniref:Phosphotransferase n=1 Tax=Phaeocystidibacter marisrubri TaxID=1577780 RepID=A0A6L3ZDJ1_9FLAO|nr:phosphotransferase [Phaeocystidibacter marisrubri]KAB2815638.1 phosphotransferase [Phaeocystidibacter marisrubri]GGH64930.1 phosphotransferase [Phaeocystidibacter marisrubri]